MTRSEWIRNQRERDSMRNQSPLGAIVMLLAIIAFMIGLGFCTVRSLEYSFAGMKLLSVHQPDIDGSVLVTYERYGEIFGRTFADKNAALAFAESIR
ncbi:hypothetical protein SDC9_11684 [bioreactor metagenome]|uniref:Uncharacterized protein n=1 Tax=bioreactor metagenome TaxID=1076179 RepID=A0A644TGE1_9ZZZZ